MPEQQSEIIWFNPEKPLWLPEGSVRALVAGGVIIAALYAGIWAQVPKENLTMISGWANLVIGFYFGQKVRK